MKDEQIQRFGTVLFDITVENRIFSLPFHVVRQEDIEPRYDGIIGNNILSASKSIIDLDAMTVTWKDQNIVIPTFNSPIPNSQVRTIIAKDTRSKTLIQNLRLAHLEVSAKKSLVDLLLHFKNDFHLPGDKLISNVKAEHAINTTTQIPIYIKNYRLPEFHKIELEKQIIALLDQ